MDYFTLHVSPSHYIYVMCADCELYSTRCISVHGTNKVEVLRFVRKYGKSSLLKQTGKKSVS